MVGFPQQAPLQTYSGAATPGDMAFDAPMNATSYNLFSSGTPNIVGNAFTLGSPAGANPNTVLGSPNAGTAQVGGTGTFAGILINSKQYVNFGTAGNPLAPTITLPDYEWGSICYFGQVWVSIDNLPNIGDLPTYNPATGAISSIVPTVKFVGSSSTTTLTVASISAGRIYIGMPVLGATGVVVPGTYVTALGSGLGGTGTYTINNSQSIAGSSALTAPNIPAPAVSATATIATTTMTVSAISAGEIYIGMAVNGAGVTAGTVVTAFGSGVGGTGTYTVNNSQTVTPGVTITDSANIVIPNSVVSHFSVTQPGLAVISMTNA